MALTGLQIYKLLPRTNCGECNYPTCMAFAMALAQKKAELAECPYVTEEAKAALGEASAPPIKLVTIGVGENKLEAGNETELFRHEKTFYHPAGIAVLLEDTLQEADLKLKIEKINSLSFERVGMILKVDLIALKNSSGNPETFARSAELIGSLTGLPLILLSSSPAAQEKALEKVGAKKPLLYAASRENWQAMAELAKKFSVPLAVKAEKLEELPELTEKIKALGVEALVMDSGSLELNQMLADQTQIRRLALKKAFRPLGYPTVCLVEAESRDLMVLKAAALIGKYAGIIVLGLDSPEELYPLLTLRQNIYTDPQKPIQVEAKVYEIGHITESSPLLVTTNFSLSYFTVAGEIEASKIPANLLVVDTEGTSVLTAWAADKFNGELIAKALKNSGLENKLSHKKIVIPGYVAVISGALEDESGWEVLVGPKEAAGIPAYLKSKGPSWS